MGMSRGYVHITAGACRGQKCQLSAGLELHMVMSCLVWALELNPGPLKEEHMFLIAEPSPQHLIIFHSELIVNFGKYFSPSVGVIL